MIQLSVSFLAIVIAAVFAILVLFTVYLFVQREREASFNKKRKSYLQRYTQLWNCYLFEEGLFSVRLVPRGRADVEAIEIIFLSYLKNIASPAIRLEIKNFSNRYLKEFYKKDLASKRWSTRMNALYRIAGFGMDELLDTCRSLEHKNVSKEERFQLLKIYSLFQPDLFTEKLKQLQDDYSESEYRRLLVLLDDDLFIRFFDAFQDWSLNIQFALIDTAAVRRNAPYVDKLKHLLSHDNAEIRIRALKGIYEIGIIDEIEIYLPFVSSDVWEERLMAAKIFKHAPLANMYAYLEQLLQDESWLVRSQAAETIAVARQGGERLQQFIQYADNEYAVDIAKETLMRKQESR